MLYNVEIHGAPFHSDYCSARTSSVRILYTAILRSDARLERRVMSAHALQPIPVVLLCIVLTSTLMNTPALIIFDSLRCSSGSALP